MSPLWRKPKQGKTFLVLDVENGSVGSALVHITPGEQPKLFGEKRVWMPVADRVSGAALQKNTLEAAHEALLHASEVAARLRGHEKTAPLGTVARTAIFLAPPWGKPNLAAGKPDFVEPFVSALKDNISPYFEVPAHTYTAAAPALHGLRITGSGPCLVCTITGEVTELLLVGERDVLAHATIPIGRHLLIRTLGTHAGLSEHESRSAAQLPFDTPRLREPFISTARHFTEQFSDAAKELFAIAPVQKVHILSQGRAGEWFAEALGSDAVVDHLESLFPEGGEVRALHSRHFTPHIAAHAAEPDLFLLLQALFVHSHFNTHIR